MTEESGVTKSLSASQETPRPAPSGSAPRAPVHSTTTCKALAEQRRWHHRTLDPSVTPSMCFIRDDLSYKRYYGSTGWSVLPDVQRRELYRRRAAHACPRAHRTERHFSSPYHQPSQRQSVVRGSRTILQVHVLAESARPTSCRRKRLALSILIASDQVASPPGRRFRGRARPTGSIARHHRP